MSTRRVSAKNPFRLNPSKLMKHISFPPTRQPQSPNPPKEKESSVPLETFTSSVADMSTTSQLQRRQQLVRLPSLHGLQETPLSALVPEKTRLTLKQRLSQMATQSPQTQAEVKVDKCRMRVNRGDENMMSPPPDLPPSSRKVFSLGKGSRRNTEVMTGNDLLSHLPGKAITIISQPSLMASLESHSQPSRLKEYRCKRTSKPMSMTTAVTPPGQEAVIAVPVNHQVLKFREQYLSLLHEQELRRKSLKFRKKWQRATRKIITVLRISHNMATISLSWERKHCTYVDIGASLTETVTVYGCGMSIDHSAFQRHKEMSLNVDTIDTLMTLPEERTLVQLESARRALQKVPVFSEYPLDVQEQVLRNAFYLYIGPNRVILRQGHTAYNVYIIMCGQAYVKKYHVNEEKNEVEVSTDAFLKVGDTFGSYSLLANTDRLRSVISMTKMQLLSISGDDYLHVIVKTTVPGQLPPYVDYISGMNFMENFPIHLLVGKLTLCAPHSFRRNVVITDDSKKCASFFIVKHGYCKVFVKLHDNMTSVSRASSKKSLDRMPERVISSHNGKMYVEKESPYIIFTDMQTPLGKKVRVPVVKASQKDLNHQPLTLPAEQRLFVPLMLLREGDVFGLDTSRLCPHRHKSRSTILVSLGAEVISLNKDFFQLHAAPEALEVFQKTFIYDDIFIKSRVRSRVNRDVHLEEVLKFYFMQQASSLSTSRLPQIHM